MLAYDGQGWSQLLLEEYADFVDVFGLGADDVYVLESDWNDFRVWRYDGLSWDNEEVAALDDVLSLQRTT